MAPPFTTTTTNLPHSTLSSLLLTTDDLPAGWTVDTTAGAGNVVGSPICIAHPVLMTGSTTHVTAVFTGPVVTPPPDAIVTTVGEFRSEAKALATVVAQRSAIRSCNVGQLQVGGKTSSLTVAPLPLVAPSGQGVSEQIVVTTGTEKGYVDIFFGVRGTLGTTVAMKTSSASTAVFLAASQAAYAKL